MTVSLRELQENFQAYILENNKTILKTLPDESNVVDRIDIYRKGYTLRLLEILEKDFPILRKYLGEEVFEKISREYIINYPSTHFSVCRFSCHFSQFLMEKGYEAHWSEMAAFEWALSIAIDAADAPQIGIADLGSVPAESWPYIQFDFHPSMELYKFRFNAPQIVYAILTEQESVPDLVENEQPVDWIVWRHDMNSYFESVTKSQFWMINAIRQQKTFSEICEGLCEWLPEEEVAMYAAGSLRNWIEKGLFSVIKIAELVPA